MTEGEGQLLGLAAKIADLYGQKLPVLDLYGPDGSSLYQGIMRDDRAEIDDLLQLASTRHPGPLLELACGTGRTALPFLEEGYEVVGLDASSHMLQRLAERLQEPQWQKYADHLTIVENDMTDFALRRRFRIIVLGMSTVWLLDEDQRASLFRCVRHHLSDDGRFLLTLQESPNLDESGQPIERTHTFVAGDGSGPVLCTMIEYMDPKEKIRLLSMLSHRVQHGSIVHSAIYMQRNHLISVSTLEKEVERSGMRVVDRVEISEETRVTKAADTGRRRWILEISA